MKAISTLCLFVFFAMLVSCDGKKEKETDELNITKIDNPVLGTWIKTSPAGTNSFTFKENGIVEGDFGHNGTVDIIAAFEIKGDTMVFSDKEGLTCPESGMYKMYQSKYYTSFDLLSDDCNGRIKSTMGFWTRPYFYDLLKELDSTIAVDETAAIHLTRARLFMALGNVSDARKDFDVYLEENPDDARALINRAGTRFPFDLEGVVDDCNKAIEIDATNKNGFFLRGLARYELGEKEEACSDFEKAIELGFSILRIAEEQRCADFWEKSEQ